MARLKMPGKKISKVENIAKSPTSQESTNTVSDSDDDEESCNSDGDKFSITAEEFEELFGESSSEEDKEFLGFKPSELPLVHKKRVNRRHTVHGMCSLRLERSISPPLKRCRLSTNSDSVSKSRQHGSRSMSLSNSRRMLSPSRQVKTFDNNPYAKTYSSFRRSFTPSKRLKQKESTIKKVSLDKSFTSSKKLKERELTSKKHSSNNHKNSIKNDITESKYKIEKPLIVEKIVVEKVSSLPDVKTQDTISKEVESTLHKDTVTDVKLKQEPTPERSKRVKPNDNNSLNNPYAKQYKTHARQQIRDLPLKNQKDDSMTHLQSKRKQDMAKKILLKAKEKKQHHVKQPRYKDKKTDEKLSKDASATDGVIKKKSVRLKNVTDVVEIEKPKKSRLKNLPEEIVKSKYQRATFSSNKENDETPKEDTDMLKCNDDINNLLDDIPTKLESTADSPTVDRIENKEKSVELSHDEDVIEKRRNSLRSQPKPNYAEESKTSQNVSNQWSEDSDDEVPLSKLNDVNEKESAPKKSNCKVLNKIKHTTKRTAAKIVNKDETSDKKTSKSPVTKRRRRIRCQKCDGCLVLKDCLKCIYCKDRVCYGGRGTMKRSCVKRQCTNPVEREEFESKAKKSTSKVQKIITPPKKKKLKKSINKENVSIPAVPQSDKKDATNTSSAETVAFGKAKSQPWKNDFKISIPWPEGDNEDAAWKCGYHFCIVLPSSMPKGDLCFLCGSSGFGEIVHCQYCSEAFHAYCLDIDPVDTKKWSCDRCKRCTVCGLKQNLLMCDHCHDCYHSDCLGPNYQRETVGDCEFWMCGKCVKCEKCGARTPGKGIGSKWKYDFTMCHECGRLWRKGHYCTICKKCYSEDDFEMEMALCTKCNHWIHRECEGITKDEYECLAELPDTIPYVCQCCHDNDDGEPLWKKEVREEMQAGFQKVCFDMVASRDYKALIKIISKDHPLEEGQHSQELFQKLSNQQLTSVKSFVEEGTSLLDNFKSVCQNGSADFVASLRTQFLLSVKKLFPWHEMSTPPSIQKQVTCQALLPHQRCGILATNCNIVTVDHCYSLPDSPSVTDNSKSLTSTLDSNKQISVPPFKDSSTDESVVIPQKMKQECEEPDVLSGSDELSRFCDKKVVEIPDVESSIECIDSELPMPSNAPVPAINTKDAGNALSPGLGSPFTNWKRCQIDRRQCSLCGLCGHFSEADAGRLLLVGVNEWVHINCALWSAEVFEDKHGQLVNVHTAISRGKMLKCDVCQQYGATIGCCTLRCPRSFHFQCARSIPTVLQDDKKLFCPQHSSKCQEELVLDRDAFMVDRKVTVDLSKAKLQKKMLARFNAKDISLLCGSLRVISFGELTEASDTKQQLFPIGYRVNRMFWCTKNPQLRCLYICSIEKVEENTQQQNDFPLNMGGETMCHDSTIFTSSPAPSATTTAPIKCSSAKSALGLPSPRLPQPVKRKTPPKRIKHSPQSTTSTASNAIHSPSKQVTLLPRPTNGICMLSSAQVPIQCNPPLFTPLAATQQSPIKNIFQMFGSNVPQPVNHSIHLTNCQSAASSNRYQSLLPSPTVTSLPHPTHPVAVNHGIASHGIVPSLPPSPVLLTQNMVKSPSESFVGNPQPIPTDPALFQALTQLQQALLASVRVNASTGSTVAVSLTSLGIDTAVVKHIHAFMESNPLLTRQCLPHLERLIHQQLGIPIRILVNHFQNGIVVPIPSMPNSGQQVTGPSSATAGKHQTLAQLLASPSQQPKKITIKPAESKIRKKQIKPASIKKVKITKAKAIAKTESSLYDTAATVTINSSMETSAKVVPRQSSSGNVTRLKKSSTRRERKKIRQQQLPEKITPKLKFVIRNDRGWECENETVEGVYTSLIQHINEIRLDQKDKPIPLTSSKADALDFFGLTKEPVVKIIEQLPGSRHCHQYMFKYHLPIKDDTDKVLPLNPHGCARAEIIQRSETRDIFAWLASPHRLMPDFEAENVDDSSVSLTSAQDLPMAMRYRQLKTIARNHVGAYRSAIHGRGLFCKRAIEVNDMIIEYSGIVIRKELTDKREMLYEKKGYGCYMFRVDDSDVVDATLFGNAARFINHSCDPNCHSKVISVDGRKKIIIFATRRIQVGEELTYDYKFPLEDEKIPCFCGSKKCRKYLN